MYIFEKHTHKETEKNIRQNVQKRVRKRKIKTKYSWSVRIYTFSNTKIRMFVTESR